MEGGGWRAEGGGRRCGRVQEAGLPGLHEQLPRNLLAQRRDDARDKMAHLG